MTKSSKSVITAAGVDVQFLIDAEDSGGGATAFVTKVSPAGYTLPAHRHDWDETMFVIDGTLTFVIDGVTSEVSAGNAVFIAKGQVHKYENLTDVESSMLIVSTPGLNHESYFAEVAEVLNGGSDAEKDAKVRSLMDQYGVVAAQ
ncbi:MAG: cupin domain-containing protein [Acidimicrobiales bacterium]